MHISPTIVFRKTVASLLLVMLVFVYAEKSFHIHEKANNNIEQTGISIAVNNTGCSICDFTLAKDGELPMPSETAILFTFLNKEYIPASIAYPFQITAAVNDRGPPSL